MKPIPPPGWGTVVTGITVAFIAGAIAAAVLIQWPSSAARAAATVPAPAGQAKAAAVQGHPLPPAPTIAAPPVAGVPAPSRLDTDPIAELRNRRLTVPVNGVARDKLHDTFTDPRSGGHHEAIDILAPRNTLVFAVEDGTIVKLFTSVAGGLTIYQFDPSERYAYYYAHLERYADAVHEGVHVTRGEILGYVGTSGNAPKDTPHLHFAIFKLTDKRQWWQGTAIDPYEVLK